MTTLTRILPVVLLVVGAVAVAQPGPQSDALGNLAQRLLDSRSHDRGFVVGLGGGAHLYATADSVSPMTMAVARADWESPGMLPVRNVDLRGGASNFICEMQSEVAPLWAGAAGVPSITGATGRLARLQALLRRLSLTPETMSACLWAAASDADAALAAVAYDAPGSGETGATLAVLPPATLAAARVEVRVLPGAAFDAPLDAELVAAVGRLGAGPLEGYAGSRADVIAAPSGGPLALRLKGPQAGAVAALFDVADREGEWVIVGAVRRAAFADLSRVDAITLSVDRAAAMPLWLAEATNGEEPFIDPLVFLLFE